MQVHDRSTSKNTGALAMLSSWMLISPQNSEARNLSLQISEIPVGSGQPVHSHVAEQCYYIIKGKGLVELDGEIQEIRPGDAIYIPPGSRHGMKNVGDEVLEYLTANSPAFDPKYEEELWAEAPREDRR